MTTDASTSQSTEQPSWGRVVMCGGTDWPSLGKKASASSHERPDLLSPHILRALSNVKVTAIYSSSASDHVVCIDVNGHAWLFGRNSPSALGPSSSSETYISEKAPKHISPATFGVTDPAAKFVSAALGKNTTILIDSEGGAWAAGDNKLGQCGLNLSHSEIKVFTKIDGPWKDAKIVSGSAGVNFSLLLSDEGKVYSFGSAEHGQLGHGRTGETIVAAGKTGFDVTWQPKLVRGALESKKIVQVASGHSHSLALDSDGLVFAWGYGGYCRMGLSDQKDQLFPVVVPQFAQERITARGNSIGCGASNSTVIDNSNTYYIAGKFKTTGPGSGGAPFTTFKYLSDLMGLKANKAVGGTGGHYVLCDEVDDKCLDATLSVGFGQNTLNGELGLGEDEPKSATRPTKILPLAGLKIIDIAASAHSCFFLVVPSDLYAELPRHPDVEPASLDNGDDADGEGEEDEEADDLCTVCGIEKVDGEGNVEGPLACDVCDKAFHIACLSPPLATFPEEPEWFCSKCEEPGKPERSQTAAGVKRKAEDGEEENGKRAK